MCERLNGRIATMNGSIRALIPRSIASAVVLAAIALLKSQGNKDHERIK